MSSDFPVPHDAAGQPLLHPSFYAATQADRPAWIMAGSGEQMTYGELDARSNQLAQLFRARGLKQGDGVVVLLPNRVETLLVYWGVQRAGLFYTPISTQFQPAEIAYILNDSDARVFITVKSQLQRLRALLVGAKANQPLGIAAPSVSHGFLLDGDLLDGDLLDEDGTAAAAPGFRNLSAEMASQPDTPIADDAEGADMLYSSGTTGQPKGVRTAGVGNPLGTLSALFRRRLAWHGMDNSTVYLSTAPLYHSAPLRYSTMTMRLGGTAIVMERFDAEAALAAIERHHITHSQWVPTMLARLLRLPEATKQRYDLRSHRFAVHAAAPCPIPVKEAMLQWWGPMLYEYYSGTEGNGQTVIGPEDWLQHKGSVGRPIHGILHICNEHGRECAAGETGTVYFEAGSTFEYYKDPDKTARARNAAGWSTLGDIGHVDAGGFLYLTDRASFMIISGGVNIYPQEVENVLMLHPMVQDVAVFGVPDAEFGEQVKAAVERVPPPADADSVQTEMSDAQLETELIAFCRTHLAHLKCPKSIDFHARLPRHDTGKLYKKPLRDAYWPAQTLVTAAQ